jgi:hypothetical protein
MSTATKIVVATLAVSAVLSLLAVANAVLA